MKTLQEKLIAYMDDTGFTPEKIVEVARERGINIGIASVYRVKNGDRGHHSTTRRKLLKLIGGERTVEDMDMEFVSGLMKQINDLLNRLEKKDEKIDELTNQLLKERSDPRSATPQSSKTNRSTVKK